MTKIVIDEYVLRSLIDEVLNEKAAEEAAKASWASDPNLPYSTAPQEKIVSQSDALVIISGGLDNRPLVTDHDPQTGRPLGLGISVPSRMFSVDDPERLMAQFVAQE